MQLHDLAVLGFSQPCILTLVLSRSRRTTHHTKSTSVISSHTHHHASSTTARFSNCGCISELRVPESSHLHGALFHEIATRYPCATSHPPHCLIASSCVALLHIYSQICPLVTSKKHIKHSKPDKLNRRYSTQYIATHSVITVEKHFLYHVDDFYTYFTGK